MGTGVIICFFALCCMNENTVQNSVTLSSSNRNKIKATSVATKTLLKHGGRLHFDDFSS